MQIDIFYEGALRTRCVHSDNEAEILTDAPKDNHGKGEEFSPTDLLAASLGSCILTIMGIYAEKKGIDLKNTRLTLVKEMKLQGPRRLSKMIINFYCPTQFDPETQKRLEEISTHCPVHLSLHPDIEQIVHFHWGVP